MEIINIHPNLEFFQCNNINLQESFIKIPNIQPFIKPPKQIHPIFYTDFHCPTLCNT